MSKQLLGASTNANGMYTAGGTENANLAGSAYSANAFGTATQYISSDGVISSLKVWLDGGAGGGRAVTWTLYLNGAPTLLSTTITDPAVSNSDVTHNITVAPGDAVYVLVTAAGGATTRYGGYSMIFTPTVANNFIIPGWCQCNNGRTTYGVPWAYCVGGYAGNQEAVRMPCAGTIDRLYVGLNSAPAGGTGYIYHIQKALGNTAITCSIIGPASTASDLVNSVHFNQGDLIGIKAELSAGPASKDCGWGVRFIPDTPGQFPIFGNPSGQPDTAAVRYTSFEFSDCQATEIRHGCWQAGFWYSNLYVRLDTTTGAGKSYTFLLRQNTGDTQMTCTITNGQDNSDLTHSGQTADFVPVDMKITPSGGPAGTYVYYSMMGNVTSPTAGGKGSSNIARKLLESGII